MYESNPKCHEETGAACNDRCYLPATGIGRARDQHAVRLRVSTASLLHKTLHCVLLAWREGPDGVDFILDAEWRWVFFKTEDDAFRFKMVWL